jgi:hypothetical protein
VNQWALVAMTLALLTGVSAEQVPTETLACAAVCSEEGPSELILDCREGITDPFKIWISSRGRSWIGPLRYVGPIEVSIQARPWQGRETLPLYIQTRSDSWAAECKSLDGTLYWQTYGTLSCDPDSMWITFPPTELAIPLGTIYWVQLVGFRRLLPTEAVSPFWRCLRVRATPTAVVAHDWGRVKALYR